MRKGGYIYIMSNRWRTVLYIGLTSDIKERVWQHKTGFFKGFTKKYNCVDLLYFEFFPDIGDAVVREKQMKAWKRDWKMELIKKENPDLKDLSVDWFDEQANLKVS